MSSDNLNSVDDNTDPLSSAAKHMDERLRSANQGALLSAPSGSLKEDVITQTTVPQPVSDAGNLTISIPADLKAFLTVLAIPVAVSLLAGLYRPRHPD